MARGDKRKRNIKRDWTLGGYSEGGQFSQGSLKTYKFKKDSLPNLQKVGAKLQKKIDIEKIKKEQILALSLKQKTEMIKKDPSLTMDHLNMLELQKKATTRSMMFNSTVLDSMDAAGAPEDSFAGVSYGEDALNGKKDNSRKAYYKEFKKVIQQADVILEILDCRDPLGCRTREVEEMIMNAGSDKKIVLILNKIDLVPKETVEAWVRYLRNEFPTIAFKASTQSQRTNLGQSMVSASNATDALLGSSESIGADNLIKLLKNYCRNVNMKTSITVGVVGFPNVGKSSVINSLKRAKVCGVGSTPGVTKVAQTIHLDKNIKLLDCPGIVFSKPTGDSKRDSATVLLRNCVKVELLTDPISPVELILERCSREMVVRVYGIAGTFSDTNEFLVLYARQRGKLLKGGIPDIENAARSIIQDWNTGKIPFYTVPPALGVKDSYHVESAVVTEMAAEFDLDGMMEDISAELEVAPVAIESFGNSVVDLDAEENEVGMMIDADTAIADIYQPEIRFKLPAIDLKERLLQHTNSIAGPSRTVLTEEEALYNPQLGQALKKMTKKAKKDQRRALKIQQEFILVDTD